MCVDVPAMLVGVAEARRGDGCELGLFHRLFKVGCDPFVWIIWIHGRLMDVIGEEKVERLVKKGVRLKAETKR